MPGDETRGESGLLQSDGIRDEVGLMLAEGRAIWEDSELPPLPATAWTACADTALAVYRGENAVHLAAASQTFWLFRKLHEMVDAHPVTATLLGDYFFSLFSKSLIPIDSVRLNDEFARILAKDTQERVSADDYLDFVRTLPMVIEA